MTLPTGTITMADVNVELGLPSTTLISLNDTAVRNLAGIPSGTISMNDLRGKSAALPYVAIGSATAPRVNAYAWSSSSGFGTKFSNPALMPTSNSANGVDYNTTTSSLAWSVAQSTGGIGNLITYPWSSSGFGTAYSAPSPVASSLSNNVRYPPDNLAVVTASSGSPYTSAYPWSSGGYGTRFANPGVLPAGASFGLGFKADSSVVAIGNTTTTPYVQAYDWSSSTGYGSRYVNPSSFPSQGPLGLEFITKSGSTAVVMAVQANPYANAYYWSGGWGTQISPPATPPTGQGEDVTFSEDGNYVAFAHRSNPFISVYNWSMASGFGSKFANPASLPSSDAYSVSFNKNGAVGIVHIGFQPYLAVYPWSSSGFGTRYADPATLLAGAAFSISFF